MAALSKISERNTIPFSKDEKWKDLPLFHLLSLADGQFAFGADKSRQRVGVFDLLFPKPPVDDIGYNQLFLKGMSEAEAHATHDADGHGFFIDSLFGTDVTLHLIPPLDAD
jgi:hypothetical protein